MAINKRLATKRSMGRNRRTVRITGQREILAAFEDLTFRVRRKALRRGVTKASRLKARVAKQKIESMGIKETGTLKKSIGYKVKTHRRTRDVYGMIGPRRHFSRHVVVVGKRKKRRKAMKRGESAEGSRLRDPTKYGWLIERGRKGVPPRPFMAAAHKATKRDDETIIALEVAAEVRKTRARGAARV